MIDRYRQTNRYIWALVAVLATLIVGFTVAEIVSDSDRIEKRAIIERRNLAVVLSEQFHWILSDLERHLKPIVDKMASGHSFKMTHEGAKHFSHEAIESIFWISPTGRMELIDLDSRLRPSLADNEKLIGCPDHSDTFGLRIARPYIMANGTKTIPFLYEVRDQHGKCLGSVGVNLSFETLNGIYSKLNIPSDTSIIIVSMDGTVIFRFPMMPHLIGYQVPKDSLQGIEAALKSEIHWGYIISPVDGLEKLYVSVIDQTFPVALAVITTKQSLFKPLWQMVWFRLAVMFIAIFAFLGMGMYLSRRLQLGARYRRNLEFMDEQIRRSSRLEPIGRMANSIAVDFKNIVFAMRQSLMRLKRSQLLKGRVELERLDRSVERANQLVDYIATVSKVPEKAMDVVNLAAVAEDVHSLLLSRLPSHINFQIDAEEGILVSGQSAEAHQIFMNLCTNAIDAMRIKGGDLRIKISRDMSQSNAIIQVTDTGVGIPQEKLPLIFEPYFTTKTQGKGTGLGLSVTRDLVKKMKGQLTVQSQVGRGSEVTVVLPLLLTEQKAVSSIGVAGIARGKVLVVDDDEVILSLVSHMIRELGLDVESHQNPKEALKAYSEHWHQFTLAIVDFQMPDLNGVELSSELRVINPGLPIVMMSGYAKSAEQVLSTKRIPGQPIVILPKPLTAGGITDVVENLSHAF